jgi:hypothetical protein
MLHIYVFYITCLLGAISTVLFHRQEQPRCRPGPPMAAFDVDVAVTVDDNDNDKDNDNSSFAPCPPSLAAALLSASFHTASSDVMPASMSLHRHCFAAILAALAMNCPCCVAVASPLLAARGKKIRETKNN